MKYEHIQGVLMDEIVTLYDIFAKLKNNQENRIHFFIEDSISRITSQQKKTFADVHTDIQLCYINLIQLGICSNTNVALNIENSYNFFICDIAIILLGAKTILHSKNDSKELLINRLKDFRVQYLISEKVVPGVKEPCKIVKLDSLFKPAEIKAEVKPNELTNQDISIVFSSGTSGIPKGLGVSERGSIESGKVFFDWMEFNKTDKFLVYLPLASYQQRFLMWSCLMKNVDIVLVDEKMLFQGLEIFQPTILIAPPNFYFNLYRMNSGSWFKQIIRKNLPYNKRNWLLRSIAKFYTYKSLYKILGNNTRYLITGMAPIDIKILKYFEQGYLEIYQIYGQSEIGMISCNKVGCNKLGTVGIPIIKLTLSNDNEIVTHSDFPTMNAFYKENGSRVELGKRIPTGDIGTIDENGCLTINGRKNETIILKNGTKINPVSIENKIKAKINIDEVVIFKSNGINMKNSLNVVLLVKLFNPNVEIDKTREIILNEPEIKQGSELVSIFMYTVNDEEKGIMYTENNKLSRVRTIELLKKNYSKLKPLSQ